MVEHQYKLKPKTEKSEYESKLRVMNKKYNSLGVTIPKEIVESIGLNKDDLMKFVVKPASDGNIIIDIQFIKQ